MAGYHDNACDIFEKITSYSMFVVTGGASCTGALHLKVKEQSFISNNFILLNHIQVGFITIYDGTLT